jgi:ABC-type transport system substrate-binding protein
MNTSRPPFDDIRVRQALTYTYRQRDFIDLVADGDPTVAANQMFDSESKFYDPDLVQLTDRPELVGDLISSYCVDVPAQCSEGKVNITYSDTGPSVSGERNFALFQEGWSPYFNVTPRFIPQDQFIVGTVLGDYQVTQFRLFGGIDPELDRVYLLCQSIGGIAVNVPRYCDPALDELLAKQASSTDEAERIGLWQQISRRINEAYTVIWAAHSQWRVAFDSTRVRDLCNGRSPDGVELQCVVGGRTSLAQVWLAE